MIPAACSVALPIPSLTPYSYAIPPALADRVTRGARVVVPVRRREMVGIVLEVGDPPDTALKSVLLAPDAVPLVSDALLELAVWLARYYATPPGIVLRSMLPAALWGRSRLLVELVEPDRAAGGTSAAVVDAVRGLGGRTTAASLARKLRRPVWDVLQRLERSGAVRLETEAPTLGPAAQMERFVVLTRFLPTLLEREREFGRAKRQRDAYDAIDGLGGEASVRLLHAQLGFSPGVLKGLVERDVARIDEREHVRDPFEDIPAELPATPTPDQERAIEAIAALHPGGALLLRGVTGSGKTLVYLEALRPWVEAGRGVIVLVPEIALTPQTVARVRGAFGDTVAVLHSGLSDGERVDAWRGLASGARRAVVGARSAVFAPVRDLAAIVVDEEHDASYKQSEQPRYHARTVALQRARIEGARVVLGSATPDLETWSNRHRIGLAELPVRVGARPLPPVTLVDMRREPRTAGSGAVPWSEALDGAVEATLRAGQQVLLLLNRRGFAHFMQCRTCGYVWDCPACSISLTVHRAPSGLRCHYCGHGAPLPDGCPECGADTQWSRGMGTQSLERWLVGRYPTARLARMDADTTSGKWSHRRILDAVARREVDVLFGTQMIAKGLDFPNVTLVGVVDADTGLHLPDFRAAERTFQLIAQVAGRAGRGPAGGRVLVQTHTPDHPALVAAAGHAYESFAAREIEARHTPSYPPHVGLVNAIVSGTEETEVADGAVRLAEWLRGLVQARADVAVEVIGPAPAPLSRIKRRWRWHVVLRSRDRQLLGRILRYAVRRAPVPRSLRVVYDRDPVSLL
jgi:primosomal protein N' (replication factor Y)